VGAFAGFSFRRGLAAPQLAVLPIGGHLPVPPYAGNPFGSSFAGYPFAGGSSERGFAEPSPGLALRGRFLQGAFRARLYPALLPHGRLPGLGFRWMFRWAVSRRSTILVRFSMAFFPGLFLLAWLLRAVSIGLPSANWRSGLPFVAILFTVSSTRLSPRPAAGVRRSKPFVSREIRQAQENQEVQQSREAHQPDNPRSPISPISLKNFVSSPLDSDRGQATLRP
jgi:hypothetical protein